MDPENQRRRGLGGVRSVSSLLLYIGLALFTVFGMSSLYLYGPLVYVYLRSALGKHRQYKVLMNQGKSLLNRG